MAEPRAIERFASLALVLEWALGLRVLAADLVQWYTQRKGVLCVFPDTKVYWFLAGTIRDGTPYEVLDWGEIPHFALRTPGYPLFLAVCRFLFGDRPIAVRLVQAGLGVLCVWLVYRLTDLFLPERERAGGERPRRWTPALVAAALVAFNPYFIVTSALILTEAVFLPLMLFGLWALAVLWTGDDASAPRRRGWAWALGAGFAWGAAVLVRPSWALFPPAALLAWVVASGRGRRVAAVRGAGLVVLGTVVVMAPWWVRNERLFGRFVPTAIWTGASLYDGLNPRATGASNMDFMNDPALWPLDEETQDALLRDRALAFARDRPGRALGLAAVKFARYWSPWPNAESFRSPLVALASATFTIPLFILMALGVWDRRRDPRALVILAGPLLYFCAMHMVFASSMRYRIPAEMPAMVLAAIGVQRLSHRLARDRDRSVVESH
ncbi:ArnT family glycosyltransferase [Singulisphaera sp. GP187]|uniref:ArnT family glycosyltransferase n=1 Tax=Singulisphaera sp. GP187 TaxID=1882752 RepID=UPI0009415B0A|nr:glycosyltransferase family 39 protein [Singulisphaera sp. GP187]